MELTERCVHASLVRFIDEHRHDIVDGREFGVEPSCRVLSEHGCQIAPSTTDLHVRPRVHPDSDARLALATAGRRWIVYCTEGFTSSLAAASLVSLGLDATDVVGGLQAWRDAGLPTVAGPTPVEQVVAG